MPYVQWTVLIFKVLKRNYLHRNGLNANMCIFSQTYCVDKKLHAIYLHKFFVQGCKNVANEKPIFELLECNILNVMLWMKFQSSTWFQCKTFRDVTFTFTKSFIFTHKGNVLPFSINGYSCNKHELIFLEWSKWLKWRPTSLSQLISSSEKNTRKLKKFTHDHFGKFDIFVRRVIHTGNGIIFSPWTNMFSITK